MSNEKFSISLKQLTKRQRTIAAISCGLLLIIVLLWLKRSFSSEGPGQTQAAEFPYGELMIPQDLETLVEESFKDGEIFYEQEGTEDPKRLVWPPERTIKLPPGKYRLRTIWELEDSKSSEGAQFSFRDPEFTIRKDQITPHSMDFRLLLYPSWKHPKLPEVAGATTTWTGSFSRNPGSKNGDSAVTYKLKMTTLNEETIDQAPCRWLQVELETSSALAPTVIEMAVLAVDTKEWKTSQEFVVRRGWIQATTEDIREELEACESLYFQKAGDEDLPPLRELTMKFDPARDVLAKKALELDAPLPEDRLSLLDVLSLVMDANLQGASKLCVAMRAQLSKLNVSSYQKGVFKPNDGTLDCLEVRSQIVSDDLHFELLRNDLLIPFSLAVVEIKHPNLEASLRLSKYSPPNPDELIAPVDEARFAKAAAQLDSLPVKTRFDLSAIPRVDGARVDYTGRLTGHGPNGGISYIATVSTLATEHRSERPCRWLRVDVTTNGSGEAITESAVIMVDSADYATTHKATILDGWLVYKSKDKEHVLPFALNGDMQKTEEDLEMLEFELPQGRLSVHDALALLFNAELPQSTSKFIELRGRIEDGIENSAGRVMTRQELRLKDRPTIPGKVWTFKAPGDASLGYTFKRSEKIPFSVFSMDLTNGPVKLSTKLDSYVISKQPPLAFAKMEWENRARETQSLIADWREQHPNFRFFTVSPSTERDTEKKVATRLLAEWAGERKPDPKGDRGDFFLKSVKGEQIRYSPQTELSADDESWKPKEVYWSSLDEHGQYVPEERIPLERAPASESIKVLVDGEEKTIKWKDLSTDEQKWVWTANKNWFR